MYYNTTQNVAIDNNSLTSIEKTAVSDAYAEDVVISK